MKDGNFGEKLKELRMSAGMTQTELGKLLGVGKTAISNYETGLSCPDMSKLIDIAVLFHISLDYLLGLSEEKAGGKTLREEEELVYQTTAQIPVLDDISEGLPKYLISQAVDFIAIPSPTANVADFFGLYIPNNSMDKLRILKGDTVLIHKQASAESGDIVLAMVKEEGPVIRKLELKQNRVRLIAQSTDKRFANRSYTDASQIQILGKVLYVIVSL